MSERLNLLVDGQNKCADLLRKYPGNSALTSIALQLEYLVALEKGEHLDRSRLKDINIGVLTAREVEPLDDVASETFYQIATASKLM